jgi:uncharacterized protein
MGNISLGSALFSRTRQLLLGLLFGHPQRSFYLSELIESAGIGRGTVQRELETMSNAGIISVKKIGNQKHYQANVECPIYEELLSIVRKTFGIADVLKEALLPVDKKIDVAFVYGSVARGEESAKSDIDVMLIGNKLSYGEVVGLLIAVEGNLGRPVNPTIYTPKQIRDKLKSGDSYISRVLKQDKLWIKGDEDAIKGIG